LETVTRPPQSGGWGDTGGLEYGRVLHFIPSPVSNPLWGPGEPQVPCVIEDSLRQIQRAMEKLTHPPRTLGSHATF
jgi:hypothetical protein